MFRAAVNGPALVRVLALAMWVTGALAPTTSRCDSMGETISHGCARCDARLAEADRTPMPACHRGAAGESPATAEDGARNAPCCSMSAGEECASLPAPVLTPVRADDGAPLLLPAEAPIASLLAGAWSSQPLARSNAPPPALLLSILRL